MTFFRDRLPSPADYFDSEGLVLTGRGKWRTTRCEFHGGSDSMRVNVDSGAWVCMNCGAKGGDVIAYRMQVADRSFVQAAKDLRCWEDMDGPVSHLKPLSFSARDALSVLRFEALLITVAGCNVAHGTVLSEEDRQRLVEAVARIEFIADEMDCK